MQRGAPYGDDTWVDSTARRCALESTLRPREDVQVTNKGNRGRDRCCQRPPHRSVRAELLHTAPTFDVDVRSVLQDTDGGYEGWGAIDCRSS
jgi:hypothetical protein